MSSSILTVHNTHDGCYDDDDYHDKNSVDDDNDDDDDDDDNNDDDDANPDHIHELLHTDCTPSVAQFTPQLPNLQKKKVVAFL